MIRRFGVRLLVLFAVLGTVGCDQVTKHVARSMLAGAPGRSYLADTIRLEYAENAGGFLSLGSTWSPMVRTSLLTIGTGAMLLTLAGSALRSRPTGCRSWQRYSSSRVGRRIGWTGQPEAAWLIS